MCKNPELVLVGLQSKSNKNIRISIFFQIGDPYPPHDTFGWTRGIFKSGPRISKFRILIMRGWGRCLKLPFSYCEYYGEYIIARIVTAGYLCYMKKLRGSKTKGRVSVTITYANRIRLCIEGFLTVSILNRRFQVQKLISKSDFRFHVLSWYARSPKEK